MVISNMKYKTNNYNFFSSKIYICVLTYKDVISLFDDPKNVDKKPKYRLIMLKNICNT